MKEAVTKAQFPVLEAFRSFSKEHGRSPTYRELAQLTGVATSNVYNHVQKLIARGVLAKHPETSRNAIYETKGLEDTVVNIFLDQRGVLVRVDSPPHIKIMVRRTQ